MKTRILAMTVALAAGLAVAGAAHAEGKIYIGAKAAMADPDVAGFDNAYTGGVYGGFNLLGKDSQFAADLAGGTLAVEGEALLTLSKGDAGAAGKWEITSVGVFAAYRHPLTDAFYLKGKAGVVRYDIDTTVHVAASGTDTKLAAGIGAGWKVGPGSIEAEITTYESDVLVVSGGFHMSF